MTDTFVAELKAAASAVRGPAKAHGERLRQEWINACIDKARDAAKTAAAKGCVEVEVKLYLVDSVLPTSPERTANWALSLTGGTHGWWAELTEQMRKLKIPSPRLSKYERAAGGESMLLSLDWSGADASGPDIYYCAFCGWELTALPNELGRYRVKCDDCGRGFSVYAEEE